MIPFKLTLIPLYDLRSRWLSYFLTQVPDKDILLESCQTVFLCEPLEGHQGLVVIPTSAMDCRGNVPGNRLARRAISTDGEVFIHEEPYIELSKFSVDGFADDEDGGDEDVACR